MKRKRSKPKRLLCHAQFEAICERDALAALPGTGVRNDAVWGGGERDFGVPDLDDADAVPDDSPQAFSGMTSEERFLLDTFGFLRLRAALT